MLNCPKCGKLIDDDAIFCTKCGGSLKFDATSPPERPARSFTQDMEQVGKSIGESISHTTKHIKSDTQDLGKRIEKRVDHASKSLENWYDRSFGIFGPLFSSFIFLIIFRIAIMVMEISSIQSVETNKIAAILLVYILPLFLVTLLSNYTQYFARKSYKFRVFSPLIYAITLILLLWIISQILYDISIQFTLSEVRTAAVSLENSLPTIFIFALLIGYVILYMSMPKNQNRT